jgi:hypothetical protein
MALVPFAAAHDIGDRLLSLLSGLNIDPPIGTGLEDELLSLTQLVQVMKSPDLTAHRADQTDVLRSAAGLHDLAAKVLSVEPLPEFRSFIPHLKLIGATKVRPASIGQNSASNILDDTARKFAELYVGCLAAHAGTEVVLDSPINPTGDNPDVLFSFEPKGFQKQRWAIAIKTIQTRQGQTIFESIARGAAQINHPRCPADRGLVLINAKNALDHERLWATEFSDIESARAAIHAQLWNLFDSANDHRPQCEWDALFTGKVSRPVLFLGQSLVRIPTTASAQTPTPLKSLIAFGANGEVDSVAEALAGALNHYMQIIVRGIPGSENRQPS